MNGRRLFIAWCLGSLAATLGPCAYAKKVRIRWKPLPGATRYELEFRRGETVTATRESAENVTDLRVILPPGRYRYRLRGYDRADRPGEWSRDLPLVVSPTKPKLTTPADDSKITLRGGSEEARLLWTDGEKPDRWRLELVRDGKAETHFIAGTDEPAWEIAEPESGKYRWRVRGEVGGPVDTLPLGAADRRKPSDSGDWKPGAWTGWNDFALVVTPEYLRARGRLKAPTIRSPAAEIVLPPGGAVELAWEPVTAAQGYEVLVEKDGKPSGTWTYVDGTRHEIQLSPGDKVRWRVRATAGEGNERAAGPETSATIATESVVRWPTESRFGVAAMGESFNLATETGGAGLPRIRGTASGQAAGVGLSFERWSWGRYGWYFRSEYVYREAGSVAQALGVSLGASGRFVLGSSLSPWSLRASLGVRYQDHPVLEPDDPAVPLLQNTVARRLAFVGPEIAIGVDYRLDADWTLGLSLGTAFPLVGAGGVGTSGLESGSPAGNWGLALRADWRWTPNFDVRFESSYRTQSAGTVLPAPLQSLTTTSNLSRLGLSVGIGWRWE